MSVPCFKCGCADFEVHLDEVDIGVGVQSQPNGGTCRVCGEIGMCTGCGAWEGPDGIKHHKWCPEVESEDPDQR